MIISSSLIKEKQGHVNQLGIRSLRLQVAEPGFEHNTIQLLATEIFSKETSMLLQIMKTLGAEPIDPKMETLTRTPSRS